MLVGKMKAWLCAALAATASGFGSICADNDVQLALDSSGMVASCAAGLAEYHTAVQEGCVEHIGAQLRL